MIRSSRLLLLLTLAICLGALPGCIQGRRTSDRERMPEVDTGMGATILMPGQSAPPVGWNRSARATPAEGEAPAGSAGPRLTTIGGAAVHDKSHEQGKEDPVVLKVLMAPFALLAKPFVAAAQAVRGEPEPETAAAAPPPAPVARAPRPVDYETQQLEAMERELARSQAGATAPRAAPGPAPGPSIADELAALQRAVPTPRTRGAPVARPSEARIGGTAPAPLPADRPIADGIVDRDGDGRVDVWIYREAGHIVRKTLDEDFDGSPDTTFHYDRESHEVTRVEEDSDRDGAVDAWTDYRDGRVTRRRVDSDRDGTVDTWTFYRDGEIARHEEDTTGDGFRDRVSLYAEGHLVRIERDADGDGRTDSVSHYDAAERLVRRDEDTDRDGRVDVVSHYEEGRLARRELLADPSTATP